MKKLEKLLKGHKHILFMDFEGTQFSHEMIAVGAVLVSLDKNLKIKKRKEPFKVYVKAKNKIGHFVSELTGITQEKLNAEGISFSKTLELIKKYCGANFKKCAFATFGNHDLRILNQSISYNFDYSKEITSQIQKNYIDLSSFISEFVKDDNGNPLSLVRYCEHFSVEEAGIAHDPEVDAINLANLYNAFIENPDLVVDGYRKVLENHTHFPDPIKYVIKNLSAGKEVTPEEFDRELRKYLS